MPEGRKTPVTPGEILEGELYGVLTKAAGETRPLSPAVVDQKLRAMEDLYEHELQIFWTERSVVSEPERRGIQVAPGTVEVPALNYPDDFFMDGRWGRTELQYRPVREITATFFSYPGTSFAQSYTLLPDWIRLDKKFGRFYIVPATGAASLSLAALNAYVLSVLGTGRGLPQALFVDYTSGFTGSELKYDHQDLLEAFRISTTLLLFGTLSNVRTGGLGSQSLSQDGQSRSQSFASGKWGAYSGAVELALKNEERLLASWRRSEKGIPFVVLGS